VDEDELARALGTFAASSPAQNATLVAIAERFPGSAETAGASVPFSSRWRWSGVRVGGRSLLLAAPELLPLGPLAERAEDEASAGRRVVAFAESSSGLDDVRPEDGPPGSLRLLGLVVLAEQLRPEAHDTVAFFRDQGVDLKVLSGDRPQTVAAIARDVGIDGADGPVDGDVLPASPSELRQLVLGAGVIGRISPEGKRRVVEALREGGRYVAMVGDGVNDVPALKAARLAIAQGTGTQMAKTVADLVLVRGEFGVVPVMVGEGRKVLRNLQRVAKLFVTKSAFAVVLIISIGLTNEAYPLLPRHLTLAAAVTIGLPSFFLALAPSTGGFRPEGFLREVARFAIPAGTAAGLGVLASYLFAKNVANLPLVEARTVATTVLVVVGLYLILALEATAGLRGAAVSALVAVLGVLYLITLAVPSTRHFFAVSAPTPGLLVISACGAAFAIGSLWLTDERYVPWRGAARAQL
jgi:magnesium-transporting ATPase (P-type)